MFLEGVVLRVKEEVFLESKRSFRRFVLSRTHVDVLISGMVLSVFLVIRIRNEFVFGSDQLIFNSFY